MFVKVTKSGYNKDGEQFCKGLFLLVAQDPNDLQARRPKLRAKLIKNVHMKQLGHWMMANVNVGGFDLVFSGSYGSDGLPFNFTTHYPKDRTEKKGVQFTDKEINYLWNKMEVLPPELIEAFWEGGGHNSAGKEGPLFKEWALKHEKMLSALIPAYQA